MKILDKLFLRSLLKENEYKKIVSLANENSYIVIELVELLEDSDTDIQVNVAEAFGWLGTQRNRFEYSVEGIALPHISILLEHSNPQVRSTALLALEGLSMDWEMYEFNEYIEVFTPIVINLLYDSDINVLQIALEKLYLVSNWWEGYQNEALNAEIKSALPIIYEALDDPETLEPAIWALRSAAELIPDVVVERFDELLVFVNHPKYIVRLAISATLEQLSKTCPRHLISQLPSFITLLDDDERRVREISAKAVFPILFEVLNEIEDNKIRLIVLRRMVVVAHINIDIIEPAIPILTDLMQDPNQEIQEYSEVLLNLLN